MIFMRASYPDHFAVPTAAARRDLTDAAEHRDRVDPLSMQLDCAGSKICHLSSRDEHIPKPPALIHVVLWRSGF
jgi:hypothetical protein